MAMYRRRSALWLSFAFFILAANRALTEDIAWLSKSDEAAKQATEADRLILVYVTRPGCKFCDKMQGETFSKKQVAELIEAEYVPLAVNSKNSPKFAKKLKITAYPTTLLVAPDWTVVSRIKGFVTAEELQKRLKSATAKHIASKKKPAAK